MNIFIHNVQDFCNEMDSNSVKKYLKELEKSEKHFIAC